MPASVNYSGGVFSIGTLKSGEPAVNAVTLPVKVDSNAVVNGQCLTATLTGNPPPGTGRNDDDISDNVAKACFGDGGQFVVEPPKSGQVEDSFKINIYPCVGVTDPPCDNTDDVRVRAIGKVVGDTESFLEQGTPLIHIPDKPNRKYDSHDNSVNSGDIVSWRIPLVWDAGELDAVNTQWSNLRDGYTASGVNGGTPPGKVHIRIWEDTNFEVIYKMTSATG